MIKTPEQISGAIEPLLGSVQPLVTYATADSNSFLYMTNNHQSMLREIHFHPREIISAFGELKTNSTGEPDNLLAVLQQFSTELCSATQSLEGFHEGGTISQTLRTAKIFLSIMGATKITLGTIDLFHILQVLEKIICKHIVSFLANSVKPITGQHDFRRTGPACHNFWHTTATSYKRSNLEQTWPYCTSNSKRSLTR